MQTLSQSRYFFSRLLIVVDGALTSEGTAGGCEAVLFADDKQQGAKNLVDERRIPLFDFTLGWVFMWIFSFPDSLLAYGHS